MPGYLTKISHIVLGDFDYQIRSLSDHQQYDDLQGGADRAGISSAQWGLFGQIWPAGQILAQAVSHIDIIGRRILELGCGLGLASLVLARRGADITASDHHPLAESFLAYNAGLNHLKMPIYRDLPWAALAGELGHFDLVIGSDILYERGHSALLADLLSRIMRGASEVLISDPGRGHSSRFTHALIAQGFAASEERLPFSASEVAPFRGRLLRYQRAATVAEQKA